MEYNTKDYIPRVDNGKEEYDVDIEYQIDEDATFIKALSQINDAVARQIEQTTSVTEELMK